MANNNSSSADAKVSVVEPPAATEQPAQVNLSVQDRILAFISSYIAPRSEIVFVGVILTIGVVMLLRATILSSLVGGLFVLAAVIFLFVVLTYNKSAITKADAKKFIELYYMHPMDTTNKPNVEHMSIRDMLYHVARCVESVPDKRREFTKKFGKDVAEAWAKPVTEWVQEYFNKGPESKKEQ